MKHKINPILSIMIISIIHLLTSCESFLEEKPNKDIVVPNTLEDMQALLDNSVQLFNTSPCIPQIAADDFVITDEGLLNLSQPVERNAYLWADEVYEGMPNYDWNYTYEQVFYANVVLEQLRDYKGAETSQYNEIKGSALFLRAIAYYQLLQVYAPAYDQASRIDTLGIILKDSPDVNESPSRASLQESYNKVIGDLVKAKELLPLSVAIPTRPTQVAALSLLSKVFLEMGDFDLALENALSALALKSDIMDYNYIDVDERRPFDVFNEEVIFHSTSLTYSFMTNSEVSISPELIDQYKEGDLRKKAFFDVTDDGRYRLVGSYSGNYVWFSGITVPEVLLTAAECMVRKGNRTGALSLLMDLLNKRYIPEALPDYSSLEDKELFEAILEERRKELVGRGTRWTDLRRLNKEVDLKETLFREMNGEVISLAPNDLKYVFPIPDDEIRRSGVKQNPR
ncbi:RagB/SusD family nutrient uptake outer membrane protein [Echinicola marina]|uniref:RagB/SusD family nutrient uptake outer membrane protein n=1 Tax=Echinicola marina TaxID=2859768 RepID=UPI001CF66982|nr:RagB/SusD family nutrient uptake outer membrane protein [Echinicola marina]UCS93222.1 RagB/SusD family nutrient uptake outer membrane protein [Echinicola marina]